MDHLPKPLQPFKPLRVPYHAGLPYSGPFEDFSHRHGWDGADSIRLSTSHSPDELARVAQSWAFFGLLQDFLNSAGVLHEPDAQGLLDDFLRDDEGYCLEEPEALNDGWEDAEVLQWTELGCTQAPKSYWKGVKRRSGERTFVTTKRLWWYLNASVTELREKPSLEIQQAIKRLEGNLATALYVVHSLEHSFPSDIVHSHERDNGADHWEIHFLTIIMSIHALRQALTQVKVALQNKSGGGEIVPGSTLLARWMTRQGWCPYQAAWVAKSFSPVSGYYISLLGPPPPAQQCHIDCNTRQCKRLDIDIPSYEPTHQPGCEKDCRPAAPDVGRICEILQDGGIPLVSFKRCNHETCDREGPEGRRVGFHMEVVRHEPNMEFYAISHVWSDGMGNPTANSLPGCSLLAIARTVFAARQMKKAPDAGTSQLADIEFSIWMDTLCVPLDPNVRKRAIRRMRDVYQQATRVIAFDSSLLQSRLRGTSHLEQGFKILSCNWQRRLWTLQEAVFAAKLTFPFVDGLLFFEDFPTLSEAWEVKGNLMDMTNLEMHMGLKYFCSSQYRAESVDGERINQTARVDRLVEMIRHFCHRNTSRLSDEAICLATLLDAEVETVVEMHGSDRFRHILEHQRAFSPQIIFLHGPKMQCEPYRWAPATFLYPWNSVQRACFIPKPLRFPGSELMSTLKLATVTASGLLIDLPAIMICSPDRGAVSGTDFFVLDIASKNQRLLFMSTIPEDGSDSNGIQPIYKFEREGNTEEGNIVENDKEPECTHVVLLVNFLGAPMTGYENLTQYRTIGLLISQVKQTNMTINGQATTILQGRCEHRVNVLEVEKDPWVIEEYGRKVLNDDGSTKGIDLTDKLVRGIVVENKLMKICIR